MFRRIDHIGLAVRDLARSARLYSEKLGLPAGSIETVASEGVRVAFLGDGETHLELLEPLDASGPVARFLDKRGEGFHHVCFEVGDIDEAVATLKADRIKLVGEAPRPGAGGSRVAFLHPKDTGGVLVELSEKPGREASAPRDEAVILYLEEPKERFWGLIREKGPWGITVEGVDLASFDDWTAGAAAGGDSAWAASLVMFPNRRIQKVLADRREGDAASFAERFTSRVGMTLSEHLSAV